MISVGKFGCYYLFKESEMQKILFVIHSLAGGGAEKVLINLVNHMDQTRFDITVLSILGGGINAKSLASHIHYRVMFPKSFPLFYI